MKGSGEFQMGSTRGVKAGVVERCQASEGVDIMLSERMWSMMMEWKTVSSGNIWVRLQGWNEKWVTDNAYGPESEKGNIRENGYGRR
jgi:ABC-type microcin C transport system permease subunit YejB